MKITGIIMLFAALTLIPVAAYPADLGRGRISLVSGDVQIFTEETEDWVPAAINTPLKEGDRVWVPAEGRTEIQVQGGAVVRLDADTSLDIISLGEESVQFAVNSGRAYFSNRENGVRHLQVETPFGSLGSFGDSVFLVDVAENGATELSVLDGKVYAETPNGQIGVDAESSFFVDEELDVELAALGPPDSWEQWNRNRDERLAHNRESVRYLPEELHDYGADLDENGRWLHSADYGHVWSPRVTGYADWSPYSIGRWVWVGGQYVWISHEPWGWAPYHYGRWVFLPAAGWCWVPPQRRAVYWAPGYVGWVHTSTYVSWVPLAPGDIFYGYGYFGPGSVNISIRGTIVKPQFRNVHVRNAVRVLHRDTFIHGRRVDFRVRQNPFTANSVRVGPPSFKPATVTRAPVIRRVPAAKLPPQRVQRIRVENLKQERKLVRDVRESVFRPERPAREMSVNRRTEPGRDYRERRIERYREVPPRLQHENGKRMEQSGPDRAPRRPEAAGERRVREEVLQAPPASPPGVSPAPAGRRPERIGRQSAPVQTPDAIRRPAAVPHQHVPERTGGIKVRQPAATPQLPAAEKRGERSAPVRSSDEFRGRGKPAPLKVQPPIAVPAAPAQSAQPAVQSSPKVEQPQSRQERVREEKPSSSGRHRGVSDDAPSGQRQERRGMERR